MLNKLLLKDFMDNKKSFVSLIIILSIGMTIFLSGIFAFTNLQKNKDNIYEISNFTEYFVYSDITSLVDLQNNLKINEMDARLFIDGNMILENHPKVDLHIYNYSEYNKYNLLYTEDRVVNPNINYNEVYILAPFANYHNLKIGDEIEINILGKEINLTIKKLIYSPEYIYSIKSADYIIPNTSDFAALYLNEAQLRDIMGVQDGLYNNFTFKTKLNADYTKIDGYFKNEGIPFTSYKREKQLSEIMLTEDIGMVKEITYAFSFIFFFISIITLINLQRRYILRQKDILGLLLSFGFSKRKLLAIYYKQSMLVWIISSVLAVLFSYVFGKLLTIVYGEIVNIDINSFVIDWRLIFVISVISFIILQFATFISTRFLNKFSINQLLGTTDINITNIKSNKKKNWKKLYVKNAFLNVMKSKKNIFSNTINFIAVIVLVFLPIQLLISINYSIEHQYDAIQQYDYKFSTRDEYNLEELKSLFGDLFNESAVDVYEFIKEEPITLEDGRRATMIVLDSSTNLYEVEGIKSIEDKGVLIPEILAGNTNEISFETPNQKLELEITDTFKQFISFKFFVDDDYFIKNISETDKIYNTVLISLDESISAKEENEFIAKLNDNPFVFSIDSTKLEKENLSELLLLAYVFVISMLAFALIMVVVSVYNFIETFFNEKKRDLELLKLVGFSNSYAAKYVQAELLIYILLSIIPGYLLAAPSSYILAKLMSNELYETPTQIFISSILISLLVLLCSLIFSYFFISMKIKKINFVEFIRLKR